MKYPFVMSVRVGGEEPPAVVTLDFNDVYTRVVRNDTELEVSVSISGTHKPSDAIVRLSAQALQFERDAFGRVPLYYGRDKSNAEVTWISTHVAPLADRCAQGIDGQAFFAYSTFSFIPAPLTPYAGIEAVPAPPWSTVGADLPVRPQRPQDRIDEETAIAQLRHQLILSLQAQCSDLKTDRVAVFLSGGLDSAVTAAALVRAGLKVTAYSLDFGPFGNPELPFAQEVADALKIPLVAVRAHPRDIRRAVNETVRALDTAFGDGVTVPLWLLSEACARDGHTVVFNGEGGDQLFGGWTNKPLIASSVYRVDEHESERDRLLAWYMRTFHRLHGYEKLCFSENVLRAIERTDLRAYIDEPLRADMELIHLLRRANLMLKGAQNIQPRASNLAFAHGFRLRSLFCHKPLADWTFLIEPELMLRGACEKYILKKAVEGWLPESIIFREKRGMGVPLTEWCIGPLWNYLGRSFAAKRLETIGYWQPDLPVRISLGEVSAHLHGRRIGEILWLMFMWEKWLEIFDRERATITATSYNPLWPPLIILRALRRESMRA